MIDRGYNGGGNMNKHKDKNEFILKTLDQTYINQIMRLQSSIIDSIGNLELFAVSEQEEFEEAIKDKGCILGCVTKDNELIAMGMYVVFGYDARNYGYDIDLEGEDLLQVGQIEATVVAPEYRGLGLQREICRKLEEEARKRGNTLLCATASPLNKHSVENFIKLGYRIDREKLKYGGLRRYILVKNLQY